MQTYKVSVKNKGGDEFYAVSEHGSITIDPEGKAIEPLETLLSALGSCMGYYVKKYAKMANIQLEIFTLNVQADLEKDKGYQFKNIKVLIDLDGTMIDDIKKGSLVEFVKNCPVHNTLKGSPEIDINVE